MSRKPYAPQTGKSQTKGTEENKKKTSLLKDNSWIKKDDSDDTALDQDPNFGRAVLSRFRSNEKLDSSPDKRSTVTGPTQQTSVQAMSKRFSASQDELDSSRSPDIPKILTKTTLAEEPKTSTSFTAVQDATKTTVTTTRTSVVIQSPTKSEVFTEKVMTDTKTTYNGKSQPHSSTASTESPTKSSSSVSKTQDFQELNTTSKEATNLEHNNIDKSPASTVKTTTSTKTYTTDDVPTSKTSSYSIRSKSSAEDQVFDIPTSIKSAHPPPAITSYERSSVTSPTTYTRSLSRESRPDLSDTRTSIKTVSSTSDRYDRLSSVKSSATTYTTYTDNRSDDYLSDTFTSKSAKIVYSTPERKVTEKDICTYCHKPMLCETKMILEDMNIKCHASCFKCEVCNSPLGHLKAGDNMWIYRRTVHCENCYGVTREKWHR